MSLEFKWVDGDYKRFEQREFKLRLFNAVHESADRELYVLAGKSARNGLYFFSISIDGIMVKRKYGFESSTCARQAAEIATARLYKILSE